MREFRLLTAEELTALYERDMKRDFPAEELKPLSTLLGLLEQGEYEPYALFEDGALLAYALYWRAKGYRYVMLDYFAVMPELRNGGTGSALLKEMLEQFCQNGGGVFGEVEIPETGDEEIDALRRRRLGFYARAGILPVGFRTKIFGVPFEILAHGPEVTVDELIETARALYHAACPDPDEYEKLITIPWEGETKK